MHIRIHRLHPPWTSKVTANLKSYLKNQIKYLQLLYHIVSLQENSLIFIQTKTSSFVKTLK